MANQKLPSLSDWDHLSMIVGAVDDIVSDAPLEYVSAGLLGNLPRHPKPISRLKRYLTADTLLTMGRGAEMVKVMPGIDSLGDDPASRLIALQARMTELPAYVWLTLNPSYADAVRTLSRLSKTKLAYQNPAREFLFLNAILTPLQIFFFRKERGLVPSYPTKRELEDAYRNARDLYRFLKEKSAVRSVVEVSPYLEKALHAFETSLFEKKSAYRKPQDDGTLAERTFRDRVIEGLVLAFGECSATLAGHVLRIIGYSHDERDLKLKIKALRKVGSA